MEDKVKARIQETCPDVMELKFGCELLRSGTTTYQVINPMGWGGNITKCWVNSVPFGDMPIELDKDLVQNGGEFEILGSPITLATVLRAIQKQTKYTSAYMFEAYGKYCPVNAFWNLEHDNYDQQSEECKQFLGTLWGVN